MKKIFHIVSNKEWGGGEQFVYDLITRQLADGHHITLFCKPIDAIVKRFRELPIDVIALPLKGVLDVSSAWQMSRVLRKAGVCYVHAHNFKDAFTAAYARRLSGGKAVRLIMSRHLTRPGKDSLPYRWLYRQLDVLHFASELARSVFLSTQPSMGAGAEKKLCVVHTSIMLPETLEAVPLRTILNIPEEHVVGMFHGRLDPEKGLDTLLDAAALLREKPFALVLVGRGSDDYTAHLKQRVADLQLQGKVFFAGFQQPVLPWVAAADFGILASTVREGCPLSPQEYMSQGHPVVVTDNGGQKEYVADRHNGLMVPPGDSRQLAEAMQLLVDDHSLLEQLGRQAKADFDDHLNYDFFYRQISRLYELAL